jgi:hypothetical protein
MRFREAGLIDIFMRMFKEEADTLCIGFAPTLMVILRSIMTDPPYLTDLQVLAPNIPSPPQLSFIIIDCVPCVSCRVVWHVVCREQKVVSYLIASHHKFGMARNLSSASPEGVRSISAEGLAKYQTTPARWRYATFRPHATQTTHTTHTTHDTRHMAHDTHDTHDTRRTIHDARHTTYVTILSLTIEHWAGTFRRPRVSRCLGCRQPAP